MNRALILIFSLPLMALSQTTTGLKPLAALPYTPSLDTASMDRTVDPCTDFYRYSCGGWIKNNPIPSDQSRWDVYSKLHQDNLQFLWGLLDTASAAAPGRTKQEQEIGDYFNACMDEASVEKAGASPIQADLTSIDAIRNLGDLAAYIAREQPGMRGRGLIFGFGANQDFSDSSREIAFAEAGGLGLPDRDYYTKTDAKSIEIRAKYLDHVRRMLTLAGQDPAAADEIMKIETALANASLTRVERRDPYKLFHKMNRTQLVALSPSFDWPRYLQVRGLAKTDEFNVTEPKFFHDLEAQLKSEKLDDWKNYLRWHVINSRAPYLSSAFATADFDFYSKTLRGTPSQPPRWRRCVQLTDRDLGEALGQVFVEKTFSTKAKTESLAMTKGIEAAMEDDLKNLSWMSDATRTRALEKLHGIINKIGYPDKWRDYSSIKLSRTDFAANVLRAAEFESARDLAKIGKPVDHGEWGMTPPTVNAYYDPQMNDINFPAGVLQPPLFDLKMDDAPNFGNTGATIGHELTHGFDDEGRQFDTKGNLHDWWTPQDAKNFNDRAQCVVDQYALYTLIDDIKINSKLTLGEDLADLGGTFLAYVAWKKADQGKELKPADGLTPDQRFFVGMAQWACGDERPENKRVGAITDPHSPPEYRINGVVANMPEFRQAFSCKVGQPMARENSCRVW
jgi:putative endopeptidase